MNADQTEPSGSDLTKGIEVELLADGAMLLGHVGQDQVILARSGDDVFAVDATCTHYGGPLAEGLLVGDTVRCPWHAARNMIGGNEPFDAVPFFWSAHYDTSVLYVGHAETWDSLQIDGSVEARDCRVAFRSAGRTLAVATIGRDLDSLRSELELETARPAQ